ncbi:hypothetical protein [Comamonas sp. JC664]|uniref:hypothetical protein n=1 Tax=Comamonas sp. JC664 TaxID=2801917 RepID=UPI001749928D|nr:hypothetical protein [Comamonas sp. JC664]MBL0692462.1 hypothetical protein [Comamonas sp. JC664]GHH01337.1 hypothetical protein GCM10012319_68990 [Comamonas sp. KCTC 72670]
MASSKRGLVDRVKEVAVQAGTRGAKVLLGTAVVTARGVASLQSRIRGEKVRRGRARPAAETPRTVKVARGVIESAKPTKAPASKRAPAAKAAAASRQTGRKAVPGQAAAAKRGTAKKAAARTVKTKRGQKHRH